MNNIHEKVKYWLSDIFDNETRKQVRDLIENNQELLTDSFYKDLEFGTGGLRGIMGVGTNRMNKYTVGMATQGLSNYLLKQFENEEIKCAIAYDSRNNSEYFAKVVASVFSANGIKVYLFDSVRPTPELSFTIRYLGCHSGVVLTASHNTKEYNGYKVYWKDGGQIITPHDTGIIQEVRKVSDIAKIKFDDTLKNIEFIGNQIDEVYISKILELCLNPQIVRESDLKILFTPIHGTTGKLIPMVLNKVGFRNINVVEEQLHPDGNFPTVKSPNPEEHNVFDVALQKAKKIDVNIILGTDPDGDRFGVVVKEDDESYIFLNGNQTASILIYYLLDQWDKKRLLKGKEYIIKTIVTTELISQIADKYNVKCYNVLTGFKYIVAIIEENYGKTKFIGGGEESYGFLAGEFVRDKDAVISCMLISEIAAWAKEQGKTLHDILLDIYMKFGYYLENLRSITKTGKSGLEEISRMMDKFRNEPPDSINGVPITLIHDFEKRQTIDMISGLRYEINLPKSNVLQYDLLDGSKISIRPSGTEPKIKFYVSVHERLNSKNEYDKITKLLNERIEKILEQIR